MRKSFYLFLLLLLIATIFIYKTPSTVPLSPLPSPRPIWTIRSIDTMKYSRDIAREKANDVSFDAQIDQQVKDIASTGASHIAIATPYDEEFVPFLTRWVNAARKYNLNVWFRGNFSGWEKWFDHDRITRAQHLRLTEAFISSHSTLFEDGDIFTPCPECENGGPGDPRMTGDVEGFRQFLIDSTVNATNAFGKIGKKVKVGYHSMNYDVAMAVMDPQTTAAVGGVVAIDHYVKTPDRVISDIEKLKIKSGGDIFLGEFGVPIPDINGKMTEDEQADWIRRVFDLLIINKSVVGMNYWVSRGGSTQLWNESGEPSRGVEVLTSYYSRKVSQ